MSLKLVVKYHGLYYGIVDQSSVPVYSAFNLFAHHCSDYVKHCGTSSDFDKVLKEFPWTY